MLFACGGAGRWWRPAVLLTCALGAGVNLTVFRLIWAVMVRPVPYADASRLMQVWQDDGKDARLAVRVQPSRALRNE